MHSSVAMSIIVCSCLGIDSSVCDRADYYHDLPIFASVFPGYALHERHRDNRKHMAMVSPNSHRLYCQLPTFGDNYRATIHCHWISPVQSLHYHHHQQSVDRCGIRPQNPPVPRNKPHHYQPSITAGPVLPSVRPSVRLSVRPPVCLSVCCAGRESEHVASAAPTRFLVDAAGRRGAAFTRSSARCR